MISKVKLLVAFSCLGLLLWLGCTWIYKKPSIEKTFVAQTLTFNDEATTAFCLASKTEHGLLTQQTTHYPVVEAFKQKANYLQKINTCQTVFDDAIVHDEMLESALYKGQLDAFIKGDVQLAAKALSSLVANTGSPNIRGLVASLASLRLLILTQP